MRKLVVNAGRAMGGLASKQRGFTLVEILIALAIAGIVAGIAVPTVAKIKGNSTIRAQATEKSHIQAAVDDWMAHHQKNQGDSGIVLTTATNDMNKFPNTTNPLWGDTGAGDFVREQTAMCSYTLSSAALVSQSCS